VPGQGATFTVLLPVATHARLATKVENADPADAGTGTVLVVDDEHTVRTVAKRPLERRGYTIVMAENGIEAIELLNEHPEIAAVLLDLAMPVMTGDKAGEQKHARWPGVADYILQRIRRGSSEEAIFVGGGRSVSAKPYKADALAAKVASVLRRSRNGNESPNEREETTR
jgi:CheY-like chemotaxis protein